MALEPDVIKILRAMLNLGSGPNTVGEIAAVAEVHRPIVDRKLKELEVGTKPKLVRSDVDEGLGETVWFLEIAGAEALEDVPE